jgi:hypothetical protein
MKRIAMIALILAAAIPAFADVTVVPTPNNKECGGKPCAEVNNSNNRIPMIITPRVEAKKAELVIPRRVFQQLQAQANGDNSSSAIGATRGLTLSTAQTVIAGLFLSLALVVGGLWFAWFGPQLGRAGKTALGLAALILIGASATMVYANIGPPPPVSRSLTSAILNPQIGPWDVQGEVKVSIGPDDTNSIQLILPQKDQK